MRSEAAVGETGFASEDPRLRGAELTVVVPTYNESENVVALVGRLQSALIDVAWEVIFVDDASPDGTAERVRARRYLAANQHSHARQLPLGGQPELHPVARRVARLFPLAVGQVADFLFCRRLRDNRNRCHRRRWLGFGRPPRPSGHPPADDAKHSPVRRSHRRTSFTAGHDAPPRKMWCSLEQQRSYRSGPRFAVHLTLTRGGGSMTPDAAALPAGGH